MPNFYALYPGALSGSNSSVAPFPGTAPTFATLVAGENSGNIVPVSVDSSGNVNVNVLSSSSIPVTGTVTANQGAAGASAWPVSVSNFPATQPVSGTVTVVQPTGSNLHVDIDNFPATQPVSGTVAVSSLPSIPAGANAIGSVSVSNFPATQPVSGTVAVSSLPSIPAGANAIGSVSVSNFPATQPVSGTVAATQSGTWTVQPGNTANTTAWLVTGAGGTFPVTGTVSVSNISTSSPVNTNGSFSQASISSASTITAPANAVGFLLEADSANTDWLRWTDSNSTASASNGMKLEPGRDTGFMPMKHNLSICPNTGTQTYSIQWVLSS
jgi:hypothetical protein